MDQRPTRHLIDSELIPAVDAFPTFTLSEELLPAIRENINTMTAQLAGANAPVPGVKRTEYYIAGLNGAPDVLVIVHAPDQGSGFGAYLHIHGGGYVLGTAASVDMPCAAIARELGCVVASVDYRLAPETSFPGNVEDCYAALRWLNENASLLGIDSNRIAIGGESAGGGLAAALALFARDRGEVKVVHQHLIYPMLDDRIEAEQNPYAGEFVWTRAQNDFGWRALLGGQRGGSEVSPYAAAARAANLEGLPPAFISVGAHDLFFDQDLEYARRLAHAGVPVECHVYAGAFHGFDLAYDADVSKRHARDQLAALKKALAPR